MGDLSSAFAWCKQQEHRKRQPLVFRSIGGFNQPDGIGIVAKVPKKSMAIRISQWVSKTSAETVNQILVRHSPVGFCIAFEAFLCFRLDVGVVTFRIQRRLPALRRNQRDLGSSLCQDVTRGSQILNSEAGLLSGITEFVVRGENNNENNKTIHPSLIGFQWSLPYQSIDGVEPHDGAARLAPVRVKPDGFSERLAG